MFDPPEPADQAGERAEEKKAFVATLVSEARPACHDCSTARLVRADVHSTMPCDAHHTVRLVQARCVHRLATELQADLPQMAWWCSQIGTRALSSSWSSCTCRGRRSSTSETQPNAAPPMSLSPPLSSRSTRTCYSGSAPPRQCAICCHRCPWQCWRRSSLALRYSGRSRSTTRRRHGS